MIAFLRIYLYWSVLWGFVAHPALGMRSLVSPLLLGMDLLVMGGCSLYIGIHLFKGDRSPLRRQIHLASFACVFLLAYGLAISAYMGSSLVDASMYVAALLRPMLILIAAAIYLLTSPPRRALALYKRLRVDILLLVGAQLAIATMQLISPALGGEFIPSLTETQSAVYALALGHVSGTFSNSIDLAYFLLAAYISLTLRTWQRRLAPPILMSGMFAFYSNATGSLTGQICLWAYIGYLWLRSLSRTNRRVAVFFGIVSSASVVVTYSSIISSAIIDKFDDMMLSRLGLIFVSIPSLSSTMPQRLLTGSGADFNAILSLLNNLPVVPLMFTYPQAASAINDVFWVAMMLAIGMPVTCFYVYRMMQLFRMYIARSQGAKSTQNLVWTIWFIVFLAGMLNQILVVRPFTLTLTLGLLPLAMGPLVRRVTGAVPLTEDSLSASIAARHEIT